MMVRWANDGVLQTNATKTLVNDGEMSVGSYTHFTIIDENFTIINEYFSSISLKYTIIRSSDHHWEAAPTAYAGNKLFGVVLKNCIDYEQKMVKSYIFNFLLLCYPGILKCIFMTTYVSLTYDSSYDYVTNPGLRTMKVYPFVVYIYLNILI